MRMQRRHLLGSALAFGVMGNIKASRAKTSARGITVFHPFEPSPYDVLSKVINEELSKEIGCPVFFEYGLMGRAAREVKNGPTDGSYLYFAALGPMVLKPNVTQGALTPADFKAVCRMTLLPIILVASKNAPFKTYPEFERYAKKNPGKVRVALTNFPSSIHSGMTYLVEHLAKLNVRLVTQPTSPLEGAIDTLTGVTDVLITHTPDAERFLKHGDFVALATFHESRLPMLPEVPTLKELGYDYAQTSWRVIVVRKETPDAVVEKLAKTLQKVVASPAVQKSAQENWEIMSWMGPQETTTFLEDELHFYEDLTKQLGIHWSQKK